MILAALHFNENMAKEQARKQDRAQRWKVSYPKFKKGGAVVRPVKESDTYGEFNSLVCNKISKGKSCMNLYLELICVFATYGSQCFFFGNMILTFIHNASFVLLFQTMSDT